MESGSGSASPSIGIDQIRFVACTSAAVALAKPAVEVDTPMKHEFSARLKTGRKKTDWTKVKLFVVET